MVLRFYVSCPTSASSSSSSSAFSSASSAALIAVFSAGPEQQAQDQSVPRRTSTASARSQRSPPDPNSNLWSKVFPALNNAVGLAMGLVAEGLY